MGQAGEIELRIFDVGEELALVADFPVILGVDEFRADHGIEGAGVENYFNDAPVDIGVKGNPGNAITPVVGEALGDFGLVLYLDHTWNDRFTSAIGYSRVDISNSNGQAPSAYKAGQYVSGNLLCTPAKNVLMGGELLWARRQNFSDGFAADDFRLQFSFKVSFGTKVGG